MEKVTLYVYGRELESFLKSGGSFLESGKVSKGEQRLGRAYLIQEELFK